MQTIRLADLKMLRKAGGLTLVELVVTITLVGIIAGAAAMIIQQGMNAYLAGENRAGAQYQAGVAMERMARELRMIRSRNDIVSMTASDLRFTVAGGAQAGFVWVSPNLSRWNGAGNDLLATGITVFSFAYFQQDGVTAAASSSTVWFIDVALTSQQGDEMQHLRTRVHPRSF
jgi:Tfp pilus assembly protein PilW